MKKKFVIGLCALTLNACSDESDKLMGTWVNANNSSSITIARGNLWFNYAISAKKAPEYIQNTCGSIVIYSNSGFNCFKFPDKTARLAYLPGLTAESDTLIGDNIYNPTDETYHRASAAYQKYSN